MNNFKIGLFTLGGIFLLLLGVFLFGARSFFEPTSRFETYIAGDVTGLSVGSAVELRGVNVGKVDKILFSWSKYKETHPNFVVVEFEVRNESAPLPTGPAREEMINSAIKGGLRARLKAQGITGASILSLEDLDPEKNPPVQVPWTPKYTYVPAAPSQLGELLDQIEKFLGKVDQVDFAGISTNAASLITDLRDSNVKLKTFLQDTDDSVKKMQLEKLAKNMDGLVARLGKTVDQLQPGLSNIDFDALNQTLETAHRTVHDMDDVLLDLKQYPSGFLWGSPPPHVKMPQSLPRNKNTVH